jgi:hypothetical protein
MPTGTAKLFIRRKDTASSESTALHWNAPYQMIWEKDTKPEEHRKPVTRAVLEQQLTEAGRTGHAEF